MLDKYICIFLWILLFISLFNLYKKNNNLKKENINEYYDSKPQYKKLKAANPDYGKVVSVDNDGNLNTFEFPKGIIVAWSGDINKIPDGWAICNGINGTPDLRGKFILGANPNSNKNSSFMVNETGSSGGEEKHTLTIEEMPRHNHPEVFNETGHGGSEGHWYESGGYRLKAKNHKSFTGGDRPHNNMPPYYALAYIMKL
jgi:hypothetical protein